MTAHTIILILVTLLDILCIIAVIFVERKNPTSTIAWVLVLLFLPFGGFVAYAMFGSGFHINKKKRYDIKRISDNMYRQILSRYIGNGGTCSLEAAQPYGRMIRYLENDGEHYFTENNQARIYTDGATMFEDMKEDMRKAQKHINLLYYIFRNDTLGKEVVSILTERARNGVEVRIIYDSLGSFLSGERMFKELRKAGGKIVPFSPLFYSLSSHIRLNYRNHRKITVIDGVVGYVGGMNIGDEYLGMDKKLHPWRDTHLRLVGPSVSFLQERFLMDWMSVMEKEMPPEQLQGLLPQPLAHGGLGVQIVSSGPDTTVSSIKSGLLECLYTARKNLYIQTPYFIPDDSFCDALRIAARAGVDVRLMIPSIGDNFFVHCATLSYARQILDAGVKVYAYNGFLHAKTIVFDSEVVSIGTANLDNRSFALNFEINAFVYDRDFALECERIFLEDQRLCDPMYESWFSSRHVALRGVYSACRLFAPLM